MAGERLDFRRLFEASPEVLLVLLPDAPRFTMVAATESRLAATHTTREGSIGKGLFEIFPDNPDDLTATGTSNLRASLERVLATRAPDTMAVQKYDIRGPDGTFEVRYWSPKNIPVLSDTGEVLYILHRVEDVTELVHASEEGAELRGRTQEMEREVVARSLELATAVGDLREANLRLGELDAAKTAFFSNVSHEFRTPLTLMLGPIEDALTDVEEPLGPRQAVRMALARDNALRLLKLVNALLDFSRLEAGRLRAHFAPLDLATATRELAGMFQSAVAKAGLRFVVDCPPLSGPAWVDRNMWEKIVPNLVSNAFKFTLAGEVAVRLRDGGDRFVLEVADTGSGIPDAELPHIFKRFHRVPGTKGRTHEGTGIGLSLVRDLVELHGGRVSVESQVGRGSTFQVTIPKGFEHLPAEAVSHVPADEALARDATAHAAEVAGWLDGHQPVPGELPPAAAASAPAAEGTRPTVLVVDDNHDLRAYVANLLAPAYRVLTAADGLEALDAVREGRPDVVLSDVMMPRLDGFGLVRRLRADPDTRGIPIILLSARAGEESAVQGLDAGSDDYLAKPFSARELLARVRTHTELARMRRECMAQVEAAHAELLQQADALDRARIEAERANRAKDDFMSRVSHELRTPLNAILGFAQLFEGEALTREQLENVQQIAAGGRHLLNLINELLDITRIEAGRLSMSPEAVGVSRAVLEAVELVRPMAARRGITVDVPSRADATSVRADRQRLLQILLNLLSNAVKYNREHGRITVAWEAVDGNKLRIDVTDSGAGIPLAKLPELFQPFQRLDADQTPVEGTGLGLALSRALAGAMDGRMGVESVIDRGSTFWVELPIADHVENAAPPAATSPAPLRAGGPPVAGTVLYIEDNVSNVQLMRRMLNRRPGVALLHAPNGAEGLALLRAHQPDLVLLDLHLGEMSGEEVLRQIWSDPATRPTPVVVVTADASPALPSRLKASGAAGLLIKPLDLIQVLGTIDAFLADGAVSPD